MKLSTRFFKTNDGHFAEETSNAPETFNGLRQVIFTARDSAKPSKEHHEALTNVPNWIHTQKFWVSIAGFVFLAFATVERVMLMGHLKPIEQVIIAFIIFVLGGGVEIAFYRLSKELPNMYHRQRIVSQRVIFCAVLIMWLGLVTTVLMMMRIVPDILLTVYVFAQMGGIVFYLLIDYCVRSLDPNRIDAEEAFTNYDRIRNIPHRLMSELALSLHYFVKDNAEQLAHNSFEEDLRRQVKGDMITVSQNEIDDFLRRNTELERQNKALQLQLERNKTVTVTPVTVTELPTVTVTPTVKSVTNVTDKTCQNCNRDISHLSSRAKYCSDTCKTAYHRANPKGEGSTVITVTGDSLP